MTKDFQLNFNVQALTICKRASKQLNVLKRVGKHLRRLGKLNIYHSFILSNFNYCPLTWHFCGEVNTKKIVKIQERALRFIYSDYSSSYESLLIKSQLPSLKVRRMRPIALQSTKILNNLSPAYLNDLLTFKIILIISGTREQLKTVKHGSRSFRSTAAKIRNSLPKHLRDISSFGVFKNQMHGAGVLFKLILFCWLECFYLLVHLVAKLLC